MCGIVSADCRLRAIPYSSTVGCYGPARDIFRCAAGTGPTADEVCGGAGLELIDWLMSSKHRP